MASNRKDLQPKHDGGSSITQESYGTNNPGRPGKPYNSGDNVHKGGGPKPSAPGPASQPKGQDY